MAFIYCYKVNNLYKIEESKETYAIKLTQKNKGEETLKHPPLSKIRVLPQNNNISVQVPSVKAEEEEKDSSIKLPKIAPIIQEYSKENTPIEREKPQNAVGTDSKNNSDYLLGFNALKKSLEEVNRNLNSNSTSLLPQPNQSKLLKFKTTLRFCLAEK